MSCKNILSAILPAVGVGLAATAAVMRSTECTATSTVAAVSVGAVAMVFTQCVGMMRWMVRAEMKEMGGRSYPAPLDFKLRGTWAPYTMPEQHLEDGAAYQEFHRADGTTFCIVPFADGKTSYRVSDVETVARFSHNYHDIPSSFKDGTPYFLVDNSASDKNVLQCYGNESTKCVRCKCLALAIGTIPVQVVSSVYDLFDTAQLVYKRVFSKKEEHSTDGFKANVCSAGNSLLRIVSKPLSVLGLELAAIYGVFRPYDGRRLYASLERAWYGHRFLAPCFQPTFINPANNTATDTPSHLFGGDKGQRNSW